MKSWLENAVRIGIGGLSTALSPKIILERLSSILILVFKRKKLKIIWYYSESSWDRSILVEHEFLQIFCSSSSSKRIKLLRECNADGVGPSWEWRPEEVLHVSLQTEQLSVAVLSVVLCRLQEKISKWCTECIAILCFGSCRITESVFLWKRNDRNIAQIGDDIAASLKE